MMCLLMYLLHRLIHWAANAHQTVYINQSSYALEVYPDYLGLYTSMMINNVYDLSMYHL